MAIYAIVFLSSPIWEHKFIYNYLDNFRLFFSNLIMAIYAIVFLSSPIWEYKFIYNYIENFNIHLVFQLFYETIFVLCFCIIYSPRKLPEYFFDEIVFNYKGKVFLLADISEDNKLNISNLS